MARKAGRRAGDPEPIPFAHRRMPAARKTARRASRRSAPRAGGRRAAGKVLVDEQPRFTRADRHLWQVAERIAARENGRIGTWRTGVLGIGVGLRTRTVAKAKTKARGGVVEELVIRVYVANKIGKGRRWPEDWPKGAKPAPRVLRGYRTDGTKRRLVEIPVQLLNVPQDGRPQACAESPWRYVNVTVDSKRNKGSICALVRRTGEATPLYVLTCKHVVPRLSCHGASCSTCSFTGSGSFSVGFSASTPAVPKVGVVRPGDVPVWNTGTRTNRNTRYSVDAALLKVDKEGEVSSCNGGYHPRAWMTSPEFFDGLVAGVRCFLMTKHGLKKGTISGRFRGKYFDNYPCGDLDDRALRIARSIEYVTDPATQPGDSGSPLYIQRQANGSAVLIGIHFYSYPSKGTSYAQYLGDLAFATFGSGLELVMDHNHEPACFMKRAPCSAGRPWADRGAPAAYPGARLRGVLATAARPRSKPKRGFGAGSPL